MENFKSKNEQLGKVLHKALIDKGTQDSILNRKKGTIKIHTRNYQLVKLYITSSHAFTFETLNVEESHPNGLDSTAYNYLVSFFSNFIKRNVENLSSRIISLDFKVNDDGEFNYIRLAS